MTVPGSSSPAPTDRLLLIEIEEKLILDVFAGKIDELPGFYWASQTLFGEKKQVLTRIYDLKAGKKYYNFLRSLDAPHILKPDYMLEKDGKAVFVFYQILSSSLPEYFSSEPDVFCTDANNDTSFNKDFKEPSISVFWQFIATINKSHAGEKWLGGKFSLDGIFVNVDEGIRIPRIFILPTLYERRARKGKWLLEEPLDDDKRTDDFVGLGKAMHGVCSELSIKKNEAYEIFDLIQNLLNKKFKSMHDLMWHPALILERTKLELITASQEGIFKQDKIRYHGNAKVFNDPAELKNDPWTERFEGILGQLDENVRNNYTDSAEPNNLYNIRLFSRNIVEHIDSHRGLQNQYGDGASFIRFLVRTYYPRFFFDLITCISLYNGRVAIRLKEHLNGNRL